MSDQKLPIPPFTEESAKIKIKLAEDAWNSQDPIAVSLAYTVDSEWRNRSQFITGRAEIQNFLADKWQKTIGHIPIIESPCGLSMNIEINPANGLGLTGMRIGNLMKMD